MATEIGFLQATSAEPEVFDTGATGVAPPVGSDNDKTIVTDSSSLGVNSESISYSEQEVTSPLYAVTIGSDGGEGRMYKFRLLNELKEEQEIRPNLRRLPNERPFYIQMVDSDLRSHGIVIDDILITSIRLAPNPSTLTINSAKIVNRYHTMTRWVEVHWGDEIDTITFSGSTFSFFGHEITGLGNTGLTLKGRQKTKAYQYIRELSKIFKYNGAIYQDSATFNDSEATTKFLQNNFLSSDMKLRHPRVGMIKERLYLNMFFDYVSFVGRFETFDIIEDSSNPFQFTYNAVFKAERTKYHQGTIARDYVPSLNFANEADNTGSGSVSTAVEE